MPRCKTSNNSVLMLNQWRREGTIRIPDVQRSLVWTTDQKRLLIDSLIREYDVPKVYLKQVLEDGIVYYDESAGDISHEIWNEQDNSYTVSMIDVDTYRDIAKMLKLNKIKL